jgi:hypothetical protein
MLLSRRESPGFSVHELQETRKEIFLVSRALYSLIMSLIVCGVLYAGPEQASAQTPTIQKPPAGADKAAADKAAAAKAVADKAAAAKAAADKAAADKTAQKTPSIVKCALLAPEGKTKTGSTAVADWIEQAKKCNNSAAKPADGSQSPNPVAGFKNHLFLVIAAQQGQLVGPDKTDVKVEDLKLMIDEVAIGDAQFTRIAQDGDLMVLATFLDRTEASKPAWSQLLAQRLKEHTVRVTLMDGSKKPFPTQAYFDLRVMHWDCRFWFFLVIFILLGLFLATNDRFKQMLRDDGQVKQHPTKKTVAAYSLARVQMFYWFAIVVVSYVFIWLITYDRDTVNNDVLALVGISAGTFLGAVSIDSSKKSQAQTQVNDAVAKLSQAQAAAAALTARAPGTPEAAAADQAVAVQQVAAKRLGAQALADYHNNFLTDILSDENGVSFHRFQIVAWSLVLGVIFVASVINALSMPTFGNTLLGLMGISGGTYLGFKFPEQKTPSN